MSGNLTSLLADAVSVSIAGFMGILDPVFLAISGISAIVDIIGMIK